VFGQFFWIFLCVSSPFSPCYVLVFIEVEVFKFYRQKPAVFSFQNSPCAYAFVAWCAKNGKNVSLTSAECSEEHSLLSKPFETTTRENQLCLPSQKQPMCLCFCCLMCKKKMGILFMQNVLELPACKGKRFTRDCKKNSRDPLLRNNPCACVFVAWRARMSKL